MKKCYKLIGLVLAITISLVACESENQNSSNSQNIPDQSLKSNATFDNQQVKMSDESYQEESIQESDYLIQNADMYFETLKYDEAKKALLEIIKNSQGTIQYQNEYLLDSGQTSDANQELRELSLIARIPQADFNQTVEKLQNLSDASLQSARRGSEDVTRSINDIDIRIEAVEDRLERLNDLINKTEKIEEIVQIQTEIENAIVQRDQYLAEKANLKNKVDLATINITLSERYILAEERNQNYSFKTRIVKTFKQALVSTKWMVENLVLFLVAAFPFLVIFSAMYLVYRLVIRPVYNNYRKKHPKKEKVNRMSARLKIKNDKETHALNQQNPDTDETADKSNK